MHKVFIFRGSKGRQYLTSQERYCGKKSRTGGDKHFLVPCVHCIADIKSYRSQCNDVLCKAELPADEDCCDKRMENNFKICDVVYWPEILSADQLRAGQICKHADHIENKQGKNPEISEYSREKKMDNSHGVNDNAILLFVRDTGFAGQYFIYI